MADLKDQMTGHMNALEQWMAPLFAKAPHLPDNARKVLGQIAPWLALVFGILGLLGLFALGAISVVLSPMILLAGGMSGILLFVTILLGLGSSILDLMAFAPLQKYSKKGWNYLFYGSVLGAVSSVLSIAVGEVSVLSLIFTLIGFWLLFEIRGLYR